MKQMKAEIFGITLNREQHKDSWGKMRLYWVLKDQDGHIDLINKTWEGMLYDLMYYASKQRSFDK